MWFTRDLLNECLRFVTIDVDISTIIYLLYCLQPTFVRSKLFSISDNAQVVGSHARKPYA